jgi:protein tyrosine phosphatase (PTP) superfamily phosphohydrolase (DUF442 family)
MDAAAMTDPLAGIYNYRRLGDMLSTSGQPGEAELAAIAEAGFEVVINLGLSGTEYALRDERGSVERLGMDYLHIPVLWEAPSAEDLDRFIAAMQSLEGRQVFVHCAANKRVSTFIALYRIAALGWPRETALGEIRAIWEPNPIWQRFIDTELSRCVASLRPGTRPRTGTP